MKINIERFLRKDHSFKYKKVRKVARLQGLFRDCIYQAMRIMTENDPMYKALLKNLPNMGAYATGRKWEKRLRKLR